MKKLGLVLIFAVLAITAAIIYRISAEHERQQELIGAPPDNVVLVPLDTLPVAAPPPVVVPPPIIEPPKVEPPKPTATVEYASLLSSPEAMCTKMRVFLRNVSSEEITVRAVELDGVRRMDMETFSDLPTNDAEPPPMVVLNPEQTGPLKEHVTPPMGAWQSHHALPNPIQPNSISEVMVSLCGAIQSANLKIELSDGPPVELKLTAAKPTLRLSQVTFDPLNPNKVYVYCQNDTFKDVRITEVSIGGQKAKMNWLAPSDGVMKQRVKVCAAVEAAGAEPLRWLQYTSVGVTAVVGEAGQAGAAQTDSLRHTPSGNVAQVIQPAEGTIEKAFAVVRVMNFFPINAWDFDFRPELYFDSEDMKGQRRKDTQSWPAPVEGRPWRAFWPIRDVNSNEPWDENAVLMLKAVDKAQQTPGSPAVYCNVIEPVRPENVACFGEVSDFLFINVYRARTWGAGGNAIAFNTVRPWIDPKPLMASPEAFIAPEKEYWSAELNPDAFRYAVWRTIGEGAKGISYYRRNGKAPSKGYTNLPEIEREVGKVNLDLQIIKPFLRIGDTFYAVSGRSGSNSILCGNLGMVFILTDRDRDRHSDQASEWKPLKINPVSFELPAGVVPGRLFKVEQGLREVDYGILKSTPGSVAVIIRPEPFVATQAYLLTFADGPDPVKDEVRAGPPPAVAPLEGETPEAIKKAYDARMKKLMAEFLDPWNNIEPKHAFEAGLQAGALRDALVRQLAESGLAE